MSFPAIAMDSLKLKLKFSFDNYNQASLPS